VGLISVVDVPVWLGTLSPMPRMMRVEYPGANIRSKTSRSTVDFMARAGFGFRAGLGSSREWQSAWVSFPGRVGVGSLLFARP
jgi:hypothetical protein